MKRKLAQILRTYTDDDRLLLYRSAEEREALVRWILTKGESHPQHPKVSDNTDAPIHEQIKTCTRCPKNGAKKFGAGSGSNSVMVILNAPAMLTSYEKNEMREESVGMIKKIIESVGLELKDCYVTNMIKCEMDSTDRPSTFFQNCSLLLERELEFFSPRIVLVMGDLTPMRKIRRKFLSSNWFEIPHPITMLKNPDLKRDAWRTLKLIISLLEEENEKQQ